MSHNIHICHDEENKSSSSKYLSYVDRSQIPSNCHDTDVRYLAYRCNANDNYCFQSMRVRRRHYLGITMCWPLYRKICRIQGDGFCGDNLLKIIREILINAIPTREFGQFKVDSCLLMRPKSNMEKDRCDRGGGIHDKCNGIQHACKAEYIIVDNAGKCNVSFHYDLIEPGKNTDLGPLQKYCFWPSNKYSLSP